MIVLKALVSVLLFFLALFGIPLIVFGCLLIVWSLLHWVWRDMVKPLLWTFWFALCPFGICGQCHHVGLRSRGGFFSRFVPLDDQVSQEETKWLCQDCAGPILFREAVKAP